MSKQLQKKYSEKVRIIACYNPDVAKKTKATRERNIALCQELVDKTRTIGDLESVKKSNDRSYSLSFQGALEITA